MGFNLAFKGLRPYIDTGLFRNEKEFFSKESQGKYNFFISWDGG